MIQKIIDFTLNDLIDVLIIIITTVIAYTFISSILRKLIGNLMEQTKRSKRSKRIKTLERAFFGTARFIIIIITFLMIISELGFNIGPLLASAGLLGLAISMGSKEIVGDFLAGIFILIDDLYAIGDEVEVLGFKGTIKRIDLRKTIIKSKDGKIHIIPNGKIKEVTKNE